MVIVDEVQQIADWERAVASLNGEDGTEVVISGSNATLLSAELATLIAGRYVTLQVFPLTLAEFGELYRQRPGAAADDAELFRLYLRIGGLPGLLHTDLSDLVVDQMLADMVSTIVIRDVVRPPARQRTVPPSRPPARQRTVINDNYFCRSPRQRSAGRQGGRAPRRSLRGRARGGRLRARHRGVPGGEPRPSAAGAA